MSLAKPLKLNLPQRLSIRTRPPPRLLKILIPSQRRRLLASLARSSLLSPTRHLCLTSILKLLIKQVMILLRAKNPQNSISSHRQTEPKPRSPKVPLVFLVAKNNPNPIYSPRSWPPRAKKTAGTTRFFHHLLRLWKRKPPLVNPQAHFLLQRPRKRQQPSPKPRRNQLSLRSQKAFSIKQQPRRLPQSFRLERLLCSHRPEQWPRQTTVRQIH